jgi:hypothetical protein
LRDVAGLLILNVAVFVVGSVLLWSASAWSFMTELWRLVGVAYLVGLSALICLGTTGIVLGIPFGVPLLLGVAASLVLAAAAAGVVRGVPLPVLHPPEWRIRAPAPFAVVLAAFIVVYFVALFRVLRTTPLFETDAWWVWTIRAKALYFSGDLGGSELVGGEATGYPSYPPGLSLLHASAFEAMGGPDTVTLHVQHWFLAAGFAAAVVGLLAGRVRASFALPVVLLVLAAPGVADRVGWAMADCLLGYLAGTGALLAYLWLEDRQFWCLAVATLLLAGAMLVKREGLIVVACVLLAAVVASLPERRDVWPKLFLAGVTALALAAPWRIHLIVNGLADGPTEGYFAFLDNGHRAWPSLSLVVETLFDPVWLGVGVIVLVAAAIALAAGVTRPAAYVLALIGASVVASSLVIWSETAFEITQRPYLNPVLRMTLVTLLVVAPMTAVLLEAAWRSTDSSRAAQDQQEPEVVTAPG